MWYKLLILLEMNTFKIVFSLISYDRTEPWKRCSFCLCCWIFHSDWSNGVRWFSIMAALALVMSARRVLTWFCNTQYMAKSMWGKKWPSYPHVGFPQTIAPKLEGHNCLVDTILSTVALKFPIRLDNEPSSTCSSIAMPLYTKWAPWRHAF